MSGKAAKLLKTGLSVLHYSGAGRLLAPLTRGDGIIFTLHSVSPEPPKEFEPNRILKVTPHFLETAIRDVRAAGYDIVSLDEAARRMEEGSGPRRKFACFTFDDGYRDNKLYAYPIFKRLNLPLAIYVSPAYADWQGDLWWLSLEEAIKRTDEVAIDLNGERCRFRTDTTNGKWQAFRAIYWSLRALPERDLRASVAQIARDAGYDPSRLCADMIMNWDEIRALASDPLVTIGAHTRNHYALAKLDEDEARYEITASVAEIEKELGRPCRHFSYPYGDATSAGEREFRLTKELGLKTAVTTRKGIIRAKPTLRMTGLPRVSLNGDYQRSRYIQVMLTGLPFAMRDAAKRALALRTVPEVLNRDRGAAST